MSNAKEVPLRWGSISEAARRTGKTRAALSRAFKNRLPYAVEAVLQVEKEFFMAEKKAAELIEQLKEMQT